MTTLTATPPTMMRRRWDATVTAAAAIAAGHTLIHVAAAISAPAIAGRRRSRTRPAMASGAAKPSRRSIDTGPRSTCTASQYQAAR